jgi:glycosyltransferase involved in cell wall biosynthesis
MCDQPQESSQNELAPTKSAEGSGADLAKGPADVAIWGRVPPPIGGMTVHVSRLIPVLEANGITSQAYSVVKRGPDHPLVREVSHRRLRWLLKLFFTRSEKVHYVLGGRAVTRFAASLLACLRGKKVILRVGGRSLACSGLEGSAIERWMTRFAVGRASAIIGVNPEICEVAKQLGAHPDRVHNIPGFIRPPDTGEKPPEEVQRFITGRSRVLLASGQVHLSGTEDIYGVASMLDAMEQLKESRPGLGLVIYAYEIVPLGPEPLIELERDIARRGLKEHVLVHKSTGMLWPAVKTADVMIRPTTTDGDSNAIRESISLGTPVIASDCVPRPESVLTYSTGEVSALCDAINMVLDNLDQYRTQAAQADMGQNAERIVQLVKNLLKD